MIISLNSVKQLIFVMVKWSVFFAVRTEFLNIIETNVGVKRLISEILCSSKTNKNADSELTKIFLIQ
jgi:hypothetical protein